MRSQGSDPTRRTGLAHRLVSALPTRFISSPGQLSMVGIAEVALRGMFLVVLLSEAAVMGGDIVPMVTQQDPYQTAAGCVFLVILIVIFASVVLVRENALIASAVVAASLLGMSLLAVRPLTVVDQAQFYGALLTAVAVFCVVSSPELILRIILPAVLILGATSAQITKLPDDAFDRAVVLANVIELITLLLTALLILDPLRAGAKRLDEEHARARSLELQAAEAQARHLRLREDERLLHDEVLHSLRCVVNRPLGTTLTTSERHLAARAVDLLDEHADEAIGTSELSEALTEVVERSNLTVRLGLEHMHAPEHIVVAMTRAVSEALRNVEIHSGQNEALLLGTQEADGTVLIKILDDGVGFATSVGSTSLGLTGSVVERLSDVGGSVRVTSAPKRGTTVSLRWSPTPGEPPAWLATFNLGRLLANVALPFCFGSLALCLVMGRFSPLPVVAVIAAVLVSASGFRATREVHRFGALSSSTAWTLSVVAIALVWTATWSLIPSSDPDPAFYWLVGGINALVILVIFSRRLSEGILLGAGLLVSTVLAITWRFGLWTVVTQLLASVVSSVVTVVGGLFLRIAIDQLTSRSRLAASRMLASDVSRAAADSRSRVVHADLARIRSRVADFLAHCGAGGIIGERERSEAKALEAEVRDQLTGGNLSPGLRRSLYTMRISGWIVDLRLGRADLLLHERALERVIRLLEPLKPQSQRVILSVREGTVIAVLPRPEATLGLQISSGSPGLSISTDPDFIRITSSIVAD